MDGNTAAAELRNLVTSWFKDAGILVDLLKSYIRKGVGRFPYFNCTLDEETDAVGELLQQRSINAATMERELRLMETVCQSWQSIQLNREHMELFQLAHATLQQFSTTSGRYNNSTAFFALPDAARKVLDWSHDVRAYYELTGKLNKNESAQLKRVQELCPLSESELNDFQTRLDSEQSQILSILEQRQQRETQLQLVQALTRQPAVQPLPTLNVVAGYVSTTNPVQSAAIRLQQLHNVFRDIRSPKQLTDSMAELGYFIYQLCQEGLLSTHSILRDLGQAAENSKVRRPGSSDVADHCYQTLCIQAADIFSSRDRLLLRPPATDVMQTDWSKDYAEQGHRFALFILELLEQIKPQTEAEQAEDVQTQTGGQQAPTSLTVDQLEPEVTRVVVQYGKEKYLSAKVIAEMIKHEGKQTSESQVKLTNAFHIYCKGWKKTRNRTATYTNADGTINHMMDEQKQVLGNAGRRSKKPVRYNDDD
jgi:hypothetical protein